MNNTLKTTLIAMAGVSLILILTLGAFMLGRFSSPVSHMPMGYHTGWSTMDADDCPYAQPNTGAGAGMGFPEGHHHHGGFYPPMFDQGWR